MRKLFLLLGVLLGIAAFRSMDGEQAWIRINYLGYRPEGTKVAVWAGKTDEPPGAVFQVVDAATGKVVYENAVGKDFGTYGPFIQTYRLDFSGVRKPGSYYLKTGTLQSPEFRIADNVYDGTADFCLRYMRQQRSGYNPFLKDSCHTHDGYTMYGPMPDSTHIDVSGGWHDASDYLQYVPTSANATYHLLAAFRDFPNVFGDKHQANGLEGANRQADVLDEARWGLDWLLKMHPKDDWMFNQLADDRDHSGLRIPKLDSAYGKGYERPVYFASGKPQGLFKHKNRTTGVASTAGKFSSAFALGFQVLRRRDPDYADNLWQRAQTAYTLGLQKPGVCQTAPGRSPYFYEEDNYVDDMELAAVEMYNAARVQGYKAADYLNSAYAYGLIEPETPWFGADTARHYQWYPFINIGHFEVAKRLPDARRQHIIGFYRSGIEKIWQKAQRNAFYRGIPFIWCSNNLTTSFAIQCYWYRKLTGDNRYLALEQACFDWLFGCNPWGTSFVYGLPAGADTPADPHSAFTYLKKYPIDGGLVDGPVYGKIYKSLIGIELKEPDEYAEFQSDLVVYHDDFGDYSTNEPTMDGTASLIYLLASKEGETAVTATIAPPAKAKVVKKVVKGKKKASSRKATVRKKSTSRKKPAARASSGKSKKKRRR
ncbi:glycoside hydrolase family 9 protein [Larkinella bovis]|uniref:Glycoside hydrolase family 9 protein n=1 Tax=Larkinella bovis TaxID=683041 RepID=A0ABW0IDL1_9BACT